MPHAKRQFGRPGPWLPIGSLTEMHCRAYDRLVTTGLDAVLRDLFPISSSDGALTLHCAGLTFGEPALSLEECRRLRRTYARPLHLHLRLHGKTIVEKPIPIGLLPIQFGGGEFLINGSERLVVAQLQRAAGIEFRVLKEGPPRLFACRIQPQRGSTLELHTTRRDTVNALLGKGAKLPALTLLRALDPALGDDLALMQALGAVETFRGIPANRKRLVGRVAVQDLVHPQTGEVLVETGCTIDDETADRVIENAITNIPLFIAEASPLLIESLGESQPRTHEESLLHLQRLLRPGTLPSLERARQLLHEKFSDPGRYRLGESARARLNRKLDLNSRASGLEAHDLLAALRYLVQLHAGQRDVDEVDHLANRRVRAVDEQLSDELRVAGWKFRRAVADRLQRGNRDAPPDWEKLIPSAILSSALERFFNRSEMCQLVDQTNPLAQLTHERRLAATGPGGVHRQRARFDTRDVHISHHGRVCPIETPEGEAIGLVLHQALFAGVDDHGFLRTPYRVVEKGRLTGDVVTLRADEEEKAIIAAADCPHDGKRLTVDQVVARKQGDFETVAAKEVTHIGIHPAQMVGVSAGLIPFLQHDDANRALMGANMQRQAVPLIRPQAPLVGTGLEAELARHSPQAVKARCDGVVTRMDARCIVLDDEPHPLRTFEMTANGTCLHQKPIVKPGDRVIKGQVIADGPAMRNGELALGRNVLVAFMAWEGYNFEDAIIISERLARDGAFTSIHLEEFEIDRRSTRQGAEEFTPDVPGVPHRLRIHLDEEGIVRVGAHVLAGDLLVGKVVPLESGHRSPEEDLLRALFGRAAAEVKNVSLEVPPGVEGIVVALERIRPSDEGADLPTGVKERIRVHLASRRTIDVGDKMAGRHGNKGVISKILPIEDMPHLPDGTPVDILLNPLGVPSRMNVGQILETHLGWAAAKLGFKAVTPVFDGATEDEIRACLKEANLPETGKSFLYDGRTGDRFEQPVTVGYIYMLKLHHLVDDKVHARATGPYSLITQQPLGGKARFGGQRFGEMEVWALEAYGASALLREMMTLKSDDVEGRTRLYEALLRGDEPPEPGVPASFEVLRQELRGLGLSLDLEGPEKPA